MSWLLLLIPAALLAAILVLGVKVTLDRLHRPRPRPPDYDYSGHRLRFFNLQGLDRDSRGASLAAYRRTSDEMIVWLQDDGAAVGSTAVGKFIFDPGSYPASRITPYVPLDQLTKVRLRDGRFRVGP